MKTTFLATFTLLAFNLAAQGTWTQKIDFTGGPRYSASGFSDGTKLYLGFGQLAATFYKDIWSYDASNNTWTQKANFGGGQRLAPFAFSISNKSYVGTGVDANNSLKDLWEYDPSLDAWTQKADFGGGLRVGAIAFSLGGKAYAGTGIAGNITKDFWEYDPSTNTWTQKGDFPSARGYAVATSVGGKGYAGLGSTLGSGDYNDWWQYNPTTDTWTQKANFPGGGRETASIFSIGNMIYVGLGASNTQPGIYFNDFWEYNTLTDTWTQIANFPGQKRQTAVGLSLNNKGYIGTGMGAVSAMFKDFWEYTPAVTTGLNETENNISFSLFPNPCKSETTIDAGRFLENVSISIYNSLGQEVKQIIQSSNQKFNISCEELENGLYFVQLKQNSTVLSTNKLLIWEN